MNAMGRRRNRVNAPLATDRSVVELTLDLHVARSHTLFGKGFRLRAIGNRLYVQISGRKVPLHLPFESKTEEIQKRALALKVFLKDQQQGFDSKGWRAECVLEETDWPPTWRGESHMNDRTGKAARSVLRSESPVGMTAQQMNRAQLNEDPGQPVPKNRDPEDRQQRERFVAALKKAQLQPRVERQSERSLASELGIQIGTTQKYMRREVNPLKVGTGINLKLATLLGVSLDSLCSYYLTGEYQNNLSINQIESWIRTEAGFQDIPLIHRAVADALDRLPDVSPRQSVGPLPYLWPRQKLEECEMSKWRRNKLGMTDERVERLVSIGEYDDELIAAFADEFNLTDESVREAFAKRQPW
jgi:hypothetical protein